MTIIASNSMFLVATSLLLISEFEYHNIVGETDHIQSNNFWFNCIGAVGQSFSFIFCALILYRTHLVSKKWKKTQKIIHKHQESKSLGISLRKDSTLAEVVSKKLEEISKLINIKNMIYKNRIILGILSVFGILTGLFWGRTEGMILALQIIFLCVVINAGYIIYKTRETKEALSCIRESYMVIFIIIAQLINSGVGMFLSLIYIDVNKRFCIISNVGRQLEFEREWRFLVATTLSLFGSYTLLSVSLIMVCICIYSAYIDTLVHLQRFIKMMVQYPQKNYLMHNQVIPNMNLKIWHYLSI